MNRPSCYAVFHMNLAFSAIPEEDRPKVIRQCYHPLLDVAASGIPLGVECGGWTLDQIQKLDPQWIQRFAQLLKQGACQLIGSGYIQLISPLVPHSVNRWNLKLGLERYQDLLDTPPHLYLVNEMAYTPSMLPLYQHYGASGIVMERNNFETQTGVPVTAQTHLEGPDNARLPVLWADSILFQKFQRYIHRDIHETEYHQHLERCKQRRESLPLYCSDVEIFDFRPGRYHYEQQSQGDEWQRIQDLFHQLTTDFQFLLPGQALADTDGPAVKTPDTRDPLPVKKQPKYNIARWAVTGRDDLRLNTLCHRLARTGGEDAGFWKKLCQLWSSDLRTHIGEARFEEAERDLKNLLAQQNLNGQFKPSPDPGRAVCPKDLESEGFYIEQDKLHLGIQTAKLKLDLNPRRGLAIKSLGFVRDQFTPLIGTLPHGYFHHIRMGADFYSGGLIIELPGQLRRITDLDRMTPQFFLNQGILTVRGQLETSLGTFVKTLSLRADREALDVRYDFLNWERPFGIVRVGNITLLPEAFQEEQLQVRCHNGGATPLTFKVKPCNHGAAVSSLISCGAGFGAVEGFLELSDGQRGVVLTWDPSQCAAFPMLVHQPDPPSHFTRLIFSLAELDDTRKPGGSLAPLHFTIRPLANP